MILDEAIGAMIPTMSGYVEARYAGYHEKLKERPCWVYRTWIPSAIGWRCRGRAQ